MLSISESNIVFCPSDSILESKFCFSEFQSDKDTFIPPSFESEIISLILSVLIFISDNFSLLSVESIFSVLPPINSLL